MTAPTDTRRARRIIGRSLDTELAAKVKAARRGIPLRKLFEDMWELYLRYHKEPRA